MSDEVTVTPVSQGTSTAIPVVDMSPAVEAIQLEAPLEETPKETPKPEKPKEKVASKLSQIAEREARAAAREVEADRKHQEAAQMAQLVSDLKKSPGKALAGLGISFNDLAAALLSEPEEDKGPSDLDQLKMTVQEMKDAEKAREAKAIADADAYEERELNKAIDAIKVTIDRHVNEDPDKYDLILATKSQTTVWEVMEESYKQTGNVMHYAEAAKLVEDYLTEEVKLVKSSKKMAAMFTPSKPAKSSFARTLTSQVSQVASATSEKDVSKMSHEERLKHAAKMLRFN